jgi:hypothetical protein
MLHRFATHMLVVFPTQPSSFHMPLSGLFIYLSDNRASRWRSFCQMEYLYGGWQLGFHRRPVASRTRVPPRRLVEGRIGCGGDRSLDLLVLLLLPPNLGHLTPLLLWSVDEKEGMALLATLRSGDRGVGRERGLRGMLVRSRPAATNNTAPAANRPCKCRNVSARYRNCAAHRQEGNDVHIAYMLDTCEPGGPPCQVL